MRAIKELRGVLGESAGERGVVLVTALLMMLVLLPLGAAFLAVSLTETTIASNEVSAAQSFSIAEAGIEHARKQLVGADLDVLLLAGGSLFTAEAFGGGNYSITVSNNHLTPPFPRGVVPVDLGGATADTDGFLLLTSTGRYGKAAKRIAVVVGPGSPFQWGAFGDSSVSMAGDVVADSYDSTKGPYDPLTAGSDVNVGSNGDITLVGAGTTIYGDATAGGTISGGTVTGTSTENAPPVDLPDVDCPSGGYTPSAGIPDVPGVTYNPTTGVLKVTAGANLTLLTPPTTYYFSKVTLSGGSILNVTPAGAHVDMFISNELDATGGALVNPDSTPHSLTIFGCGPSTAGWKLTGGTGAYFAVYAPNHRVKLTGGGDLWGSIVADEVVNSGGVKFHYDTSLAWTRGPLEKFLVVPGFWRELPL